MKQKYRKGDRVRGVPGRDSHGWCGTVTKVEELGVVVDWDGRRNHADANVRRHPELFMLFEQIMPYEAAS